MASIKHWLYTNLASNAGFPTSLIWTRLAWYLNAERSKRLSQAAVKLCGETMTSGNRILEVGFGQGLGLELALASGATVYGVEMNDIALEQQYKRLEAKLKTDRLNLIYSDVTKLPFPNSWFHAVFHINTFPYWSDLNKACRELYRICVPGGVVICTFEIDSKISNQGFVSRIKESCLKKSIMLSKRKRSLKSFFELDNQTPSQTPLKSQNHPQMSNPNLHLINQSDPLEYMLNLERVGFESINMEYHDEQSAAQYQSICAVKPLFESEEEADSGILRGSLIDRRENVLRRLAEEAFENEERMHTQAYAKMLYKKDDKKETNSIE